ncbi:MAG: amino acid adenylation domain-containing protein, partial [Bacteroidota bacterium]
TFSQQVKDLQETYDSSEAFRQMPFDKLVKELAPEKDMSRTALFDVLFQYEEPIDALPTIDGVAVEWTHTNLGYGKYDLNFFLQPTDQHLSGQLVYNADYFDHSTIERFIAHYEEVLQAVLKHPEVAISEVDMVTQKEKDFLLKALDHTAVDFPKNKTIVDFFEAQVDRQPDKTAITFEDQSITYAALDQRANQVAHLLKAKGIQGNEIVGLLTDRSLDVVVSMLGILKAGGAYLPIDVDYPRERIDYILENSGVRLLLTDDKYPTASLSDALTIMSIEAALQQATDRLESTCQPSDLCYIIYTSGTTGNPKGVMVEHRNVVRLFFNDAFQFDFGPSDTWTMFHSHCFDFSVWEMYGALLFGGRLIVIPKIVAKDATAYLQLLEREGVTVLNQTPSAFYQLTREELLGTVPDLSLRYVVFGGEALSPAKLKNWKATYPEVRLINMYGITETTVHVTFKEIEEKDIEQNISNIGTPIPTLLAYILDENRRLVPQGTIGELYVGGEGVTRGYLNRRALTNEKFIADPHGSNGKLYRTGDLARLLNNGEIEYIGRIDNQVQLRGFRIELGEIENQLATHQAIGETVVVAKEDEGDKFLIAYYVAKQSLEVSEMRNFLSAKLPDYMIPSYFVHLPTLPLTSNGKVDKKSLPDPQITSSDTYKAPVNAVEEKLVEIWSDILKLEKEVIGTESSFFDLGGHSLRAAVLVNKVSKELEVNIQLKEIFINQSIKELANYILAQSKSTYTQIEKAAEKEYYRLSSGQKRLYFLYEFDKESLAYNMPYVLELKGELDIDRLNQAFERLIDRHESLRTGFEIIGGAPVQRVYDKVDFKLACFHAGRAEVQGVIENFIRPFDLKQAPLLRVGIVELNPTEHLLMMDIHHIVTDGVSQRVLIDDFRQLYSSDVSLPPLQKQYKDYAEWQQQSEQQKEIERQKAFWMAEFADEASPIDLPTDFARPPLRKYDGGAFSFEMSVAESQQLKKIAEKEQTTLFMLLLACYNVLLSKLSNLEDITVGVPVAGRQHADLEKMIGMFVNTLAIRNQPEGKMTFTDFLAKVKSKTLACFENQSYQYEELVEELNIPRDTSRNPLFDLMFTFENFEEARFEIPALDIQPYDNGHAVSKFDLTLTASETADQIFLYFEYAKDLFTEETIERFTGYFRQILSTIATKPNSRIADIQMLQAAERTQILKDFNDTNVSYPPVDSILEVFEQQAAAHPDRVAIRFDRGVWTYRRLQVASDKVAYFLSQTKGWKKGDFIGLMLEREPAFLAILFGILKAGGVYVPIDPKYPADRVQAIVEEAGMKVLFTRGQFPKTIDAGSTEIIDLDTDWRLIRNMQYKRQAIKIDPKDLAYIIFTSGSTGRPKGVMIEHASLANIIRYMEDEYPLGASDSYLLKTTCCFDVSITEIFGWFFNGGSITLLPPRAEADPDVILDTIEKHQVTHINFVPSMFSVFVERLRAGGLEKLRSLKYIFLAGEALPRELVSQFDDLQTGILLENIYGPTEGTIYSCGYSTRDLGSKKRVPIGKPLSNISLYILDKNRSIQPVGVPGELCIGGAALARGYLNNEELTAEKFVAHPFEEGARIYRTGDLVRWLPDGNIEYLGRIDNQVKIRGYRIELGEIEIRLAEHEAIQECAVMVKERMGDKYLVGYYVSENALRATELVEHLATSLPAYMVPRYYVHMDKMPWTTNGKLNRRALPEPQVELEANYQAPIGETEEKLVEIWSKVLGLAREKISTDANFFDLGGHSLKIISMCNMVNDSFQANITVAEIFRLPHINAIAEFLHHGDQKLTEIEQGLDERSDALELLGRLGE